MKHPFIVLLAMVILVTLALGIWLTMAKDIDYGRTGLTTAQKANAKNVVLSSGLVNASENGVNYRIDDIKRPGPDFYTYDQNSTSIAVVPVNFSDGHTMWITVDLNQSHIVSVYDGVPFSGITKQQQLSAIRTATNDQRVQEWLGQKAEGSIDVYPDGYIVGQVQPANMDDYGYVDPFGFYVDVPLWYRSGISPANQYADVIVDLAANKTMVDKQWYGEALMGYSIDATISPGQYFYKKFHSGARFMIYNYYSINRSDMWTAYYRVSQQPADASLNYFIVDEENFRKLWNKTAFYELKNISNYREGSNWSVVIPKSESEFYMVVKNGETKRDARIVIRTESFYY